ncbi:PREDICTED: putative odorant receptor 92a [Papilio xuthus]|uniref:Odorant receptor n=1 Tax=Papilio xuthus TaxID=66420 RepID=A0AAJ6ZM74_PAPXU|nr:PREDICTED: putative odorant receptor 92a [Papilio xuthus]WCC57684.1 odorant receptor 34 [Papilio xuthus]
MSHMSLNIRQPILNELEFLRTIGSKIFLFPFIGRTKYQIFGFYTIKLLVICTTAQLFLTLCHTGFRDIFEIINIAPNLGVCAISAIKYTKIHTNRILYDEIFCHFKDELWDIVSIHSNAHIKVLKKYKFISMIVNRFIFYYSIPLIIVVNSFPYLVMTYENRVLGEDLHYLYPFDGWYPFDKVKWYWGAYIWESTMTALVVCVYLFSNMMQATYILFICMELKILGHSLEELISTEDVTTLKKGRHLNDIHKTVLYQLKIIIRRHHRLATISASLDKVLGDAMLLNYSLGAIFICLTAYTFTVVEDFYQSVRYFSFFMSLLVESFNQCIVGQVLSDHSEDLTESIYSADWPNASQEVKKIMLMFMMRTQKPFKLTANGYLVMNLNTFSAICSTSYQFFNLLRTVYP